MFATHLLTYPGVSAMLARRLLPVMLLPLLAVSDPPRPKRNRRPSTPRPSQCRHGRPCHRLPRPSRRGPTAPIRPPWGRASPSSSPLASCARARPRRSGGRQEPGVLAELRAEGQSASTGPRGNWKTTRPRWPSCVSRPPMAIIATTSSSRMPSSTCDAHPVRRPRPAGRQGQYLLRRGRLRQAQTARPLQHQLPHRRPEDGRRKGRRRGHQGALVFVSRCQNLESEHNTTPSPPRTPTAASTIRAAGGGSPAGKTPTAGCAATAR